MRTISQEVFEAADDFVVIRYTLEQAEALDELSRILQDVLPRGVECYSHLVSRKQARTQLLLCKAMRRMTLEGSASSDLDQLRQTLETFFTPRSEEEVKEADETGYIGTATLQSLPSEVSRHQPGPYASRLPARILLFSS